VEADNRPMLRVGNIAREEDLELVRDALDDLGADYEHVDSEPDEDAFPQTAYFYVPDNLADDISAVMERLSDERGFDAEVL
jgi:hypothetical protein